MTRRDFLLEVAESVHTDDCVLWPFAQTGAGYGKLYVDGQYLDAHRAMCVFAHGDRREEGLDAEHLCGSKLCINPLHVEWAEHLRNMQRKREHGTQSEGEEHSTAKLTDAEAIYIRDSDESPGVLAARFKISRKQVWNIRTRKQWSHLP